MVRKITLVVTLTLRTLHVGFISLHFLVIAVVIAGVSADNANVNFGTLTTSHNNVHANMCSFLRRDLMKARCNAHICHNSVQALIKSMTTSLAVAQFTNVESLISFERIVYATHKYFSKSSKRLKVYMQIASRSHHRSNTSTDNDEAIENDVELVCDSLKPALKPVKTRWCSFRPAIDRILRNWHALGEFFAEEASRNRQNTAAHDLCQHISETTMAGSITKTAFLFVSHVLQHFESAERKLQFVETSIADAQPILVALSTELRRKIESDFAPTDIFGPIDANDAIPTDQKDQTKEILHNCYITAIQAANKYLHEWGQMENMDRLASDGFSLRYLAAQAFSVIEKPGQGELAIVTINERNVEAACLLAKRYELGLGNLQSNLSDAYHKEFNICRNVLLRADVQELSTLKLSAVWQRIFKSCDSQNEMPLLIALASFVLSAPASSASVERVFSMMNFRLRKERRSLNANHLRNELFIRVNLSHISLMDFPQWAAKHKHLLREVGSSGKYTDDAFQSQSQSQSQTDFTEDADEGNDDEGDTSSNDENGVNRFGMFYHLHFI